MHTVKSLHGGKGRGTGKRHSLVFGLLTAAVLFAAFVTLVALLVFKGNMAIEQSGLIGKLLFGTAVFAGCFVTARRTSQAKPLWAALTGMAAFALVLGAVYAVPGERTISFGSLLGVTAAAWLLAAFAGTRKKRNCYF